MHSAHIGGKVRSFIIVLCNYQSQDLILNNYVLCEMIKFMLYKWEFVKFSKAQLCIASMPLSSSLANAVIQAVLAW